MLPGQGLLSETQLDEPVPFLLKPVLVFVDCEPLPLDFSFPTNSIFWDVYIKILKFAGNLELKNVSGALVDLDLYLLKYMADNGPTVYVHKKGAESSLNAVTPPPMLSLKSAYRKQPVKGLQNVSLHATGEKFLAGVASALESEGLSTHVQIFNSALDELSTDCANVSLWLSHTHSEAIIIVPEGRNGQPVTAETLRQPYALGTNPPYEHGIRNLQTSDINSRDHHRGHLLNAQAQRQDLSINLTPGASLKLSSDTYNISENGLNINDEVIDALSELKDTLRKSSPASSYKAGNSDSELDDAMLGRYLKQKFRGTELGDLWQNYSDESVADVLFMMLRVDTKVNELIASSLGQQNVALIARSRHLEARLSVELPMLLEKVRLLEAARSPAQQRIQVMMGRLSQGSHWLAAGCVIAAKYVWWAAQQDLTVVSLYTMFWLWTLNIVDDKLGLREPIEYILIAYLLFNLLNGITMKYMSFDLLSIFAGLFPQVFPEDAALMLGPEAIHRAAQELISGTEVDYRKMVDSMIMRPSLAQILAISVAAVVPSVLRDWHKAVDKRAQKAVDDITAAVQAEKKKIEEETPPESTPAEPITPEAQNDGVGTEIPEGQAAN